MLTNDQVSALTDELLDLGQTHGPGANILCQILQTLDVLERTRTVPSKDALRLAHLAITLAYAAPLTDAAKATDTLKFQEDLPRKFPRSLAEAFPKSCERGCAVVVYRPRHSWWPALLIVLLVAGAFAVYWSY